jgi:hypothetical protein
MDEELRLSLLGGMQILRGGMPITGFISAKVPAPGAGRPALG